MHVGACMHRGGGLLVPLPCFLCVREEEGESQGVNCGKKNRDFCQRIEENMVREEEGGGVGNIMVFTILKA